MNDLARLIDDWEGHLARKGRSLETRRHYRRTLWKFADHIGDRPITRRECERFLNKWAERSPATLAARTAALAGFTAYLVDTGELDDDPMRKVSRPRRLPADELDVVTVSTDDVRRLFDAVTTWTEALALAVLVYTGARRNAAARLRWRDVDLARGEARFREKGGKAIVKPLADDLRELLVEYAAEHEHDTAPDDYVIPNLHPWKVRSVERDDRVVWRIVLRIARRAGVRAHVHSLRAAFAVFFLEHHGGTIDALKEILGHRRIETTYVYLRRLDRRRQMEQLRGLSWGTVLPAKAAEAHTGFEPVLAAEAEAEPSGTERAGKALIDNPHFRSLLDRLREPERERRDAR